MTDPRPTLAEGVRLVGNEPLTNGLLNRPNEWINRQAGVRPASQIVGQAGGVSVDIPATALDWAIIENLGDVAEDHPQSMWATVRIVTLNEGADGYDVSPEPTIVMIQPGMHLDPWLYFGRFVVDSIPATLNDQTIIPQEIVMARGVLYLKQTERWEHDPLPVTAERSDCAGGDL